MLKIIFIISTCFTLSWGCLACSYGDIKVLTHLYLNVSDNTLKSVDVEWTLDPMFSQMVLGDFDLNRNGKFETKERNEVYQAILAMKDVRFFIRPEINNKKIFLKELNNFSVHHLKGLVVYRFRINLDTAIKANAHLRIRYDADAAYNNAIVFHLNEKNVFISPSTDFIVTTKTTQIKNPRTNDQILDITLKPRTVALASPMGGNVQTHSSDNIFSQSLRTLTERIHTTLISAQEQPSAGSIGAILFFSLLYGIIHAAGPGHGKTLVASYFSTNERSYKRGIAIALLIATTHVVSALIITLILYLFVHTMFTQTIRDVSLYTTKVSGGIVIGIALYLLRQKWFFYRKKPITMQFSVTPHLSSCGCHSCKTTNNSTDLMLILGAGIVPCPGTIVVFLFTLSMGMYTLGLASAIVMSLGMGLTIAATAAFGTALRKKSHSFGEKYFKIVDILGVLIMMIAGILLLII